MKTQGLRQSTNVEDMRGGQQDPTSILGKILGVLTDSVEGVGQVANAGIGLMTTGDATNGSQFTSGAANPALGGKSLDESFANAIGQITGQHVKDVQTASLLSSVYDLIRGGK